MARSTDPWAPFEPTASDPWDRRKVAHLHRRAGFGATWAELERDHLDGPEASISRLLNPRPLLDDERAVLDGLRRGAVESKDPQRAKAWWLLRMLTTPDPLGERLTLFWHGHFATSLRKVDDLGLMLSQNETIRTHAFGPFADLLGVMIADPAMLVWLDGAGSQPDHPNENFAREFLELFTLGPGLYTEADIRAAARAFSGWVRSGGRDGQPASFHLTAPDDSVTTFLGQPGHWRAADLVRITLARPEAATFLARKLDRLFIAESDNSSEDRVQSLAALIRREGFAVRPVVATILRSRVFFAGPSERARVKGPAEFAVGLARLLGLPQAALNLLALAAACDRQGQALFDPPNVKGWDGGRAWITTASLIERLNWATAVVWGATDRGMTPFDPLAWADRAGVAPTDAPAALLDLLLPGALDASARATALAPGRDGTPDGLRRTLQRLIHCPQFQLA